MNEIEVICEIGVNHGGSLTAATDLIAAAKLAGADTVKFQLWDSERVYPPERWPAMKNLELPRSAFKLLIEMTTAWKIGFLCTPDDIEDARFLRSIGVSRIKIGSSNINNLPLLREVASYDLPVLLSTGACEWREIARAVAVLREVDLTVLHCVSAYPAPLDEANLSMICHYRHHFRRLVGFSDHTEGMTAALVALGLGARVFEKHLTMDRNAAGPDHKASMEPGEMAQYIAELRRASSALGNGIKHVMPCETESRKEYDRFVRQQDALANQLNWPVGGASSNG